MGLGAHAPGVRPMTMGSNRFEHLENEPLPPRLSDALSRLNRFEHLEIGQLGAPAAPAVSARALCRHCGQSNEEGRDLCWACHKPVEGRTADAPAAPGFELVLDGKTYRSSDPQLPEDIRALMEDIARHGYSPKLLADWRQWRATRNVGRFKESQSAPAGGKDVRAFKGQRVSIIRVDGKTYTSDTPGLPPEIQELFIYMDKNGVTPALLSHLRQNGGRVKFRPGTTDQPSDGDIDFWDNVKSIFDF